MEKTYKTEHKPDEKKKKNNNKKMMSLALYLTFCEWEQQETVK